MFRLGSLVSKRAGTIGTKLRNKQHANNVVNRQMCGLVAAIDDYWSFTPSSSSYHGDIPILNSKDVLSRTASIIQHRGPDGTTLSSGHVGQFQQRWSMGHTRLAIVDPSNRNADMPFNLKFDNKTIHLAANGEIYNHNILYQELVNEGKWPHARHSGSDCEVIAHAYAKYGGLEAVKKLDGMFAFVIFEEDAIDGSVKAFAARDPVGIKPLYYGRTNCSSNKKDASAYVFASELKALVGHVDPSTVVAIPPGHYWTPETGLVCYYNPDWLRKVSFDYAGSM